MTQSSSPQDTRPEEQGLTAAHLRHELRTPLNHIIGYSEMLEEEARDRHLDDLVPDLERIGKAARTLQHLIERHLGDASLSTAAEREPVLEAAAEEIRAQLAAVNRALPDERSVPKVRDATLLVVDDSEQNRDMLSRRLRDQGYAVIAAAGGAEALRVMSESSIDLVLLDVMMPDISGIEVLQTVRSQHSMSDLPVIMATAMDRSDDTVIALKLGANDYVTKPLDFQIVLARTETQLALARAKKRIDQLASDLEARNAFIRATFDRYMSADVVDNLLAYSDGPRLTGERRKVTMLMADLRGFTTLVQQLEPERVVRILNRYLSSMTDVIREFGGTIDEFIGDGVLALFGAPVTREDDALRAVACALEMQLALRGVNANNEREGMPRLEMGIGIDTGEVIVGSIGSLVRAKYTAIGTAVNLAARIESCTVGGQVLISRTTLSCAGPQVAVGDPTLIEAKGFRDPIELFEVRSVGEPYHVELVAAMPDMCVLPRHVLVRCATLEEKHREGTRFEGRLVRLADGVAEMRSDRPLSRLQNLQMLVLDFDGRELEGDLYGKVVQVDDCVTVVRFTGMHPTVASFLRSLLQ